MKKLHSTVASARRRASSEMLSAGWFSWSGSCARRAVRLVTPGLANTADKTS